MEAVAWLLWPKMCQINQDWMSIYVNKQKMFCCWQLFCLFQNAKFPPDKQLVTLGWLVFRGGPLTWDRLIRNQPSERWCPSAGQLKVQQGEVLGDRDAVFITQEVALDGDDDDFSWDGEKGVNLLCCHLYVLHLWPWSCVSHKWNVLRCSGDHEKNP